MHQATVNDKVFEIRTEEDQVIVNGEPVQWDMVKIRDGYYHIIQDRKSYSAELVKTEPESKTLTWKINGRMYTVQVKDKFDLLLEKMGMTRSSASKINTIKAPMPGLIIDLKVKEGDQIKKGDPLLVLEAMKMENIIKAVGNGAVKIVKVKKGDSVEKGQVLVEF